MPSIYAYLLGKPNHYCSHEFSGWSVQQVFEAFHSKVRDQWLNQDDSHKGLLWDAPTPFPAVTSATARVFDYPFRPSAMERFSIYFFLAGTRATRTTATKTW